MDTIRLFNTPTVEGYKIEAYMGLVTANQVAGTGFMTDFVASFSDIFGGNSGAYREEMNRLYDDVKENIQEQAAALGGNAIIGVRVDFDNISAKNMSMFMVSMQGTVVKIQPIKEELEQEKESPNLITDEQLTLEYNKCVFMRQLVQGDSLSEEGWKYILSHNMPELAELLYEAYINATKELETPSIVRVINGFPKYLSKLTYLQAVELIYSKEDSCMVGLVVSSHLFSAKHILNFFQQGNNDLAFKLLKSDKRSYSKTDLEEMKELAHYLRNLPDTGKIEEVKGGIFSSSGLKFVCECGCKNDKDKEYCESCGRNIKGLTMSQNDQIKKLEEKVDILERLLGAKE